MHGRVPLPSAPEVTPRRRRPVDRWRIGWGGLVSALLHGGFFAALLFGAGRERPPEPLPPPSFDVEFMRAGSQAGPTAPQLAEIPSVTEPSAPSEPAPEIPPQPETAAEAPRPPQEAPPIPDPPVPPQLAEAPPIPDPPELPRLAEAPPPRDPAPPQAQEAPPPPTPPAPSAAAPPVAPLPEAPIANLPPPPLQEATAPEPPPPAPPPDAPPAPPLAAEAPRTRPTPPVREALLRPPVPPRPAPRPAFPNALDLSALSPPRLTPSAPAPAPSPPAPARPRVDMQLGAPRIGDPRIEPILQVTGARDTADWRNAFRAWLEQNKFYPRDAAELGEQGPVRLRIIVEPTGRVRLVDVTRPSYSPFLNGGALALFRGRTLPPFPPGTTDPQVTIDLTLNYILIGRSR